MTQHWAQIIDDIVTSVTVWDDSMTDEERSAFLAENFGGNWLKTDKNASYGEAVDGESDIFRGTYAGVGFSYDSTLDIFRQPMPEEPGDWVFNATTYSWEIEA